MLGSVDVGFGGPKPQSIRERVEAQVRLVSTTTLTALHSFSLSAVIGQNTFDERLWLLGKSAKESAF
jgi:hypothetical protein